MEGKKRLGREIEEEDRRGKERKRAREMERERGREREGENEFYLRRLVPCDLVEHLCYYCLKQIVCCS